MTVLLEVLGAVAAGLVGWWFVSAVLGWACPRWTDPKAPPSWEVDVRPKDHENKN